jgi:RNA polymerase sigma factor (sigma-70 family)
LENELIQRLFRHQFSKIVSVISKYYGLKYIEVAEDIVSDTFLEATETWGTKGVPENPEGWLYTVAKHKAYHVIKRNIIFKDKIIPEIKPEQEIDGAFPELDFSNENIRESTLQMMFAVCNPTISGESQIGLALRILCGFGIDEIADAFLTSKETINKRLFRAKEKLRNENIKMEMPDAREIPARLDNVLHCIYLLFNEGYYSSTQNQMLRQDLCLEALSLGTTLTTHHLTNLPRTNALVALMCYHSSRFMARVTPDNSAIVYANQNRALWDQDLIQKGDYFLERSAHGEEISSYHIEARIASWHSRLEDTEEKWRNILTLYDRLMILNNSPTVLLNRIFAINKVKGPHAALKESEKLESKDGLLYFALLGEIYKTVDIRKAAENYQMAIKLAKTESDRNALLQGLNGLY